MKISQNTKNIIFDLGNVIINVDYKLTFNKLQELDTESNIELGLQKLRRTGIFEEYEVAAISSQEFRNRLKSVLRSDVSDNQIDEAWNAMLCDYPPHRIELLKFLKHHYRLFLLSNTNEIHYYAFNQILEQNYGFSNLDLLFEKTYYSFTSKLRKPDFAIYQQVIDENKLNPSETLFIDDLAVNTIAAQQLGIQTHWLQPKEDVCDIFAFPQKNIAQGIDAQIAIF